MAVLNIDTRGIEHNTRLVRRLIAPTGARLTGVTKACLGDPRVAAAVLAGGAGALADSRPENLERLRRRFPDTELELLRPPGAGAALDTSAPGADLFFVSGSGQARSLLTALPGEREQGRPVRFVLMIESGDGREGVPVEQALREASAIQTLPGAVLAGLATNAACARPGAAVIPSLELFSEVVADIIERLRPGGGGDDLLLSVGGSGILRLLRADAEGTAAGASVADGLSALPGLSELRCGEALLLGRVPGGPASDPFLPGAVRDAFVLEGQVLEVFEKDGCAQALLDFGRQDTGAGEVIPRREGIMVRTVTSDYTTVALESDGGRRRVRAGGRLSFLPTYYSLLAAMTSPFIERRYIEA